MFFALPLLGALGGGGGAWAGTAAAGAGVAGGLGAAAAKGAAGAAGGNAISRLFSRTPEKPDPTMGIRSPLMVPSMDDNPFAQALMGMGAVPKRKIRILQAGNDNFVDPNYARLLGG